MHLTKKLMVLVLLFSFYTQKAQECLPDLPDISDARMIRNKKFIPLITQEMINQRIQELGHQITHDYVGKSPVFIGVLTGAFIFLADLVRATSLECSIDFIKISSYGDGLRSSGNIRLDKNLNSPITGRDVIIVEDIIDSGLSMNFLRTFILQQNPASLRIATFLYKPETATIDFPIDYVGFAIAPDFVLGYGLDYAQQGRNLPCIYRLTQG